MSEKKRCYSIRQLSPFIGNIQIIEADYCRALSADGKQWQIQASCETHQQAWKISTQDYIPRRYVLYGSWNSTNGFSSLPLDPMLDVPSIQHIEESLIKPLSDPELQLPFEQIDYYECWLMDKENHPLALLASAQHPAMINHIVIKPWQALSQLDQNLPKTLSTDKLQQLEQNINQMGSKHTWFIRQKDRSATDLNEQQQMSADIFPELLLNTNPLQDTTAHTANDYLDWLSPRLLSLHYLSSKTRQQLEQAAQYFAIETSRRLPVYPQALDSKIFNKIMVELKIRGH